MQVLMVETASPRRVRKKAEDIVAAGICSASDLTILCTGDPASIRELGAIGGVRLVALHAGHRREILSRLKKPEFDVVWSFWTGEWKYNRMKVAAMRIPARERRIDIGDGHDFRLSRGTLLWFLRTRWKFRRPSDHATFVLPSPGPERPEPGPGDTRGKDAGTHPGEEILIIQSAEPPAVLRALELLKKRPIFREPRYTLFCRNTNEVVDRFRGHPMLCRIVTHTEIRGALRHAVTLRAAHFDSVVVFFTGDPSYWKIKFLPFLLGARHKLIFNENGDCFFFSWRGWYAHVSRRFAGNLEPKAPSRGFSRARARIIIAVKLLLLPFRFFWLLLVWLRLRSSGLRASD